MSNGLRTSIGLLLLSGATELVVFSDGQGPIRIGLTLVFLLLAPGWAVLRAIHLDLTPSTRVGMAVAISTGIEMAAASALLYARLWSAELALTLTVAVVVIAVFADLPSVRRSLLVLARRTRDSLGDLGRP